MRRLARLAASGPDPEARSSVASAALIVAAGVLASRLLGVVRTAVIAREFGTQSDLAAYWVAFRLPDLIFQLVAGATLASAFIPAYTGVMNREGPAAAWRLASSVLNLVLLATTVIAAIAFVLAPVLVPLLAPGLGDGTGRESELRDLAVELTRIMLLSAVLFSVSGMIMGILNARRHFMAPAFAPVFYNLAIIFGALVLAEPYGVHGLAVGVVAGSALHLVVQLPALIRVGMRYDFAARWRDSHVREVFRLMLPRMVGLAAGQVNFFVVTVFFASFIGDDAISGLTFAWLVMTLPLALFGMAIGTAVFPEMAESSARGDPVALSDMIGRSLRIILYLMLPASIGLVMLGRPVVGLLLERGAFEPGDTELTANALMFFSFGLAAHGAIEILGRGFYALSDTSTPMRAALLSMVVNFVLALAFTGPFEAEGVALALTVATTIEAAYLYVRLRPHIFARDEDAVGRSLRGTLLGTVLLAEVVAFFVLAFGLGEPSFGTLVGLTFATALGGGAFFAATLALGSLEAEMLRDRGRDMLARVRR